MSERFDAVIIGAGHNGLVCAYYLARTGLKVCVLERLGVVGGAAVTEEFHPGFRNSVASYTVGLLEQRIMDDMKLADRGLNIVQRPLANFVPRVDAPGLELHQRVMETQASIGAHSQRDAERYPDYLAELTAVSRLLKSTFLERPVDLSGGWREWQRAIARLPRFLELERPGRLWTLYQLLAGSAGKWLDGWFEAPLLKGGLGFDTVIGHYASPYSPGSGYLLLHHTIGGVKGGQGAWGHAIGGMGAITQAMANAARSVGVEVRLEAPVARIDREEGVLEVQTESGSVIASDVVAAAVHPQVLFTRLLAPGGLPDSFLKRMRAWRSESATFRMNVALSRLPEFTCLRGKGASEHYGSGILISPSLDYLEAAHADASRGGYSQRPIIEILFPSTLDDSLAPNGAHVASLFCQHFRRRLPNGRDWTDAKPDVVEAIIDTVTEYLPEFRRSILAVQALSPADLEGRFGLLGGDIFHGQMARDQLYWARPARGYAQYRSPVSGVYLCGSGAHPGGGVTGAPGYNAARVILGDLGRGVTQLP